MKSLNDIAHTIIEYDSFILLRPEESDNRISYYARALLALDYVDDVKATNHEIMVELSSEYFSQLKNDLKQFHLKDNHFKSYKLPIFFEESEDWNAIEAHTGLKRADYEKELLDLEFELSMYGFIPGFLYLTGLPEHLQVPRKKVPSIKVAENSFAVGGEYLGLYSLSSPAGWHIIGKTPINVLDLPNTPPILVSPGDKIQLEKITKDDYKVLEVLSQNIVEYNT